MQPTIRTDTVPRRAGRSGPSGPVLALLLLVVGVVACSDDEPAAPEGGAAAPTTVAATPDPDGSDDPDGPGSEASPPVTVGLEPADTAALAAAEAEGVAGGSMVLALNADPAGLHPIDSQLALQGHLAVSGVFDTLGRADAEGRVVPHLATSIERNDDATQWRIGVPDGVVFHDGTPLTARVVADNLLARKNSATGVFTMSLVEDVGVDGAEVVVDLSEPWVAFDLILTQQLGYVIAPSMLSGGEDFVGTGPFRLEEYRVGETVRLTRFEEYWRTDAAGTRLPYLDELELRIITNPAARTAALETGDVDAILTISAPDLAGFHAEGAWDVVVDDAVEEAVFVLNAAQPPLDDPVVRDALVTAVDREAVNEVVNDGLLTVANGPFGPGEFWYEEDHGYPAHDPERARELVDAWEREQGTDLRVEVTLPAGGDEDELVALVSEMWEAVGIDVDLNPVEQSSYIQTLVFGGAQIASQANFGWIDPDFLYLFFHSDTAVAPGEGIGINFTHTINADLDAALETGRASTDVAVRREAYGEMVRVLNEERAYVFLFHRVVGIVARPEVNGLFGADQAGFGRVDGKPWLASLWLDER